MNGLGIDKEVVLDSVVAFADKYLPYSMDMLTICCNEAGKDN